MLKRNGFELRRLRKRVPKKKIPQTDDIFKNVKDAHRRAKDDPSIFITFVAGPLNHDRQARHHSQRNIWQSQWISFRQLSRCPTSLSIQRVNIGIAD
jgi:hypothetical protein